MITVIKNIQFSFPNASYIQYTITSDDPCVTISPSSGTYYGSATIIPVTFNFSNSDCFGDATITAYGIDNNGCTKTQALSIVDPCTTLTADIVGTSSPYTVNVSGGTSPYTISWVWDTTQYNGFPNGNQLILENTPYLKSNHVVLAQVYDANGCYVSDSVTISNCLPIIPSEYSDTAIYNGSDAYSIVIPAIENIGCGTLDYDTLEIVSHDSLGIQFERFGIKGFNFEFRPNLTQSIVRITVRMKDTRGVYTNTSVISALVITEQDEETIPRSKTIDVQNYQTAPGIGDEVIVPIVDIRSNIDYNTFEFVPNSDQSLTGSVLNGINGDAELTPNKEVKFTYNTATPTIEGIRWKANSTDGVSSENYNIYLDPYTLTPPSISNFSLSVANGNTVSDNLGLRTSEIVRRLEIITAPTKGTVTTSGSTLYYTANSGESGADSIVVKAYGLNNVFGTNVTISLTVENAGEVLSTGLVCNGGNLNLTALISGYDGTGTWAQNVGNPATVSLASPAAVSFSGKAYGTYGFTYTKGSAVANVTTYHREYTIAHTSGVFRFGLATFPNYVDLTWLVVGTDVTLGDLTVDVYRDLSANPVDDPADYIGTFPVTSFVSGVASYSHEVPVTGYGYRFKCKFTKGCGTFSALTGTYIA